MTRCPHVYNVDTCDREMPCERHPVEERMSDEVKPYTADEAREEADVWDRRVKSANYIACQAEHADDAELAATLRHYADMTDELSALRSRVERMNEAIEKGALDAARQIIAAWDEEDGWMPGSDDDLADIITRAIRSAVQRGER